MCLLFTFLAILYLYTMCLDPVYAPAESSYPFLFKNKKTLLFVSTAEPVCASGMCCAAVDREGPLDWSCCCELPSVGD